MTRVELAYSGRQKDPLSADNYHLVVYSYTYIKFFFNWMNYNDETVKSYFT